MRDIVYVMLADLLSRVSGVNILFGKEATGVNVSLDPSAPPILTRWRDEFFPQIAERVEDELLDDE